MKLNRIHACARLGIPLAELGTAEGELTGRRLRELYARAVPADPELFYTDPLVAADRLADEFRALPAR